MKSKLENIHIKNEKGVMTVSSREVAENFGKRHDKLLSEIERMYEKQTDKWCAQNGGTPMFFKTTYIHEQNKQEYPMYLMNRDGFSLLVMGFTGVQALQWKIKYIEAFNKMEQYIKSKQKSLPSNYKEALKQLLVEVEEKEKLQLENSQQLQIIGELKPKADYMDKILQNKGLVTITAIAKDYGMSGQAMNDKLHELGIQYKQSGQWFLYEKYHDKGYTHSETIDLKHKDGNQFVKMNTKWTQKGRLFLYELLKKNNLLPMIERNV